MRRLYELPTLAAMAQHIDRLRPTASPAETALPPLPAPPRAPILIPLQSEGIQPPFFCVHPVAGVVFPYYDLAVALGADQPVYGLQAVGLGAGEQPLASIAAMAEQYVAALRTVQPHGPYLLGGWSFGVHVAYEMAQRLQQAGQRVALLALIDTPPAPALSLDNLLHFTVTTALPSIWPYVVEYLALLAKRPPIPTRRTKDPDADKLPSLLRWTGRTNKSAALLPE